MRMTADAFRAWSLDQWCEHVRSLGVNSLTAWASTDRNAYNHARILGIQRQVADRLGWLPKLVNGGLAHLDEDDIAQRFRARGVQTLTDMWKTGQPWCERLRAAGRLEAMAARLGIAYTNEFHPADIDYYLKRCRDAGYFEAWCVLDRVAVWAARKHQLLAQVSHRAVHRPERFDTAGGSCGSLAELAVCRLLEANGIEFATEPHYPMQGGRGSPLRADLYLPGIDAWIEVWACELDDDSRRWTDYRRRRRLKTALCRTAGLRLIGIEGNLLHRKGVTAVLEHAVSALRAAGLLLPVVPEARQALALQRAGEMGGDGPGGGNEVGVVDEV